MTCNYCEKDMITCPWCKKGVMQFHGHIDDDFEPCVGIGKFTVFKCSEPNCPYEHNVLEDEVTDYLANAKRCGCCTNEKAHVS